eukprot:TRINITY_DN1598_c1_g2_i1.p1 TRINITY_DN1598_c1_g2~~TRINITY_DN1598_c1_g2_i1.p1  ORF type:complete len:3382 (+),score=1252.06 TRINITY_DN1598_c1_g2_i1:354-10148(+)
MVEPGGKVTLPAALLGQVRVAEIGFPVSDSQGSGGNIPHDGFDVIKEYAACVVAGVAISHNNTADVLPADKSVLMYALTWQTEPTGCVPLMASLPHHRRGGLDPALSTFKQRGVKVAYPSLLGELEGYLAGKWVLHIPYVAIPPPVLGKAVFDNEQVHSSVLVRYFEELLLDLDRFGNSTLRPQDQYGVALLHAGQLASAANRLAAQTQYRQVVEYSEKWVNELFDGLVKWDQQWGQLCTARREVISLVGEKTRLHETCYGGEHLEEYGAMLNGLVKLWDALISFDTDSDDERVRRRFKLERMVRALSRDLANLSEKDEYFPLARGFDFFTNLVFDGKDGALSPVGTAMLAYNQIARLGAPAYLDDDDFTMTGELLTAWYTASVQEYLVTAKAHAGDALGLVVTSLDSTHVKRGSDMQLYAPYDEAVVPVLTTVVNDWAGNGNRSEVARLLRGRELTKTPFDVMLLSILNGTDALQLHVNLSKQELLNYTNHTLDTEVHNFEMLVNNAPEGFVYSDGTGLPVRILGTAIWYNSSFNYFFKVMEYQPTVIGSKVTSYNIYDMNLYEEILRRDVKSIKSLGFNTLQISTDTFAIDAFIEMCKEFDMNVIVSQILPAAGFSTEKFLAEEDFVTMLTYLKGHTNIVMWSVDSRALNSVNDEIYDYYVLFRKLKLLREVHDPLKRPIAVPLTEYTIDELTADIVRYKYGVEMAIVSTLETQYKRMKKSIQYLSHPVLVNLQSDSWNHVNKTDDEAMQSKHLKENVVEILPLHREELLSGVVISEWVDQFWRGAVSDPDFDCPDTSPFRHSTCGVRVAELDDGMLTLEHQGINRQYQTWFKHCIVRKDAYYMLGELWLGEDVYERNETFVEDCVFVNLTPDFWRLVIIISAVMFCLCVVLTIAVCCQGGPTASEIQTKFGEDDEDDEQMRWVQPDTDSIYEIISQGCSTILDQEPFAAMNIQRLSEAMEEGGDEVEIEVDSSDFCRWQSIVIQLDHLEKLIFDEMVCQLWCGEGETWEGFKKAVDTLHCRYTTSYRGWLSAQQGYSGAEERLGDCVHSRWEFRFGPGGFWTEDEENIPVPIPQDAAETLEQAHQAGAFEATVEYRDRTYEVKFELEEKDEALIYDPTLEGDPNGNIIGRAVRVSRAGLGETTTDQLVDLLSFLSIWHLGEHMTWFSGMWTQWMFHYVLKNQVFPPTSVINDPRHFSMRTVTMDDINESSVITPYFDIEGTRGIDKDENMMMKDGQLNAEEIKKFPFCKTFREPRKWGIIFPLIHNIFFVVQTQVISFLFWGLVVNISGREKRLADLGIDGIFKRMDHTFFHSPNELRWILTTCCKFDFGLLVLCELIDIWMLGGLYHHTKVDWETTFKRVSISQYVKLRWSNYTSFIAFFAVMGAAFYEDRHAAEGWRIVTYVLIRVLGIVINNAILVNYPMRFRGAPEPRKNTWVQDKDAKKERFRNWCLSILFWGLCYLSVQLFQAWVMFRTETVKWDFCGCEDSYPDIVGIGALQFVGDFIGRGVQCLDEEPRCATAVLLIWIAAIAMFVIVVNAGFLVWMVVFGSFRIFAEQWRSNKARSLVGKKVQTAYILRTLNVRLLGFTDPRDTRVARSVWNRIIFEMYEEWLISAFEYENLLIAPHVSELQFALKNDFAMERLSNFLEYIQTTDDLELGPPCCYPSCSIIIPVYGEDLVCPNHGTSGAFNEKIRSHQQEQTQLRFLIECYHDEWVNFVEHCVLSHDLFEDVLDEEMIWQMTNDVQHLKTVHEERVKREMKGDQHLRNTAAEIIADKVHTQPHLLSVEEIDHIQWWASMHMQTVARTVRGMERKREAFRFLLMQELVYTQTMKMRDDRIDLLTDDKFQIILACQNLTNNKWFTKNEEGLLIIWDRFPKVEVSFDVATKNYRIAPKVRQKVQALVADLWDCTKFMSCLALWNDEEEDWEVALAYARRNPLRLDKQCKYGLNGMMQGKAVNQAHSLVFARGQLVEAIDCNQDGYFDEALKLRSVTGRFFPEKDRSWSRFKIVGFPEYSTTQKSGIIGRVAAYSEYIFVNVVQAVLANPLMTRMHYGHPDFFDKSWCCQQGGMSKPNPLINLNEDIFAGFHVTYAGESVDHVGWLRDGKGRETNFDGANGFQMKLAFGASMQFRTRDQFELMRVSDVFKRHAILYGSVGPYIYLITIVVLVYSSLFINLALTYSYKTDYSLSSRGSPYGSEWMVQMSLIEAIPLMAQLTLDYGFAGFFIFLRDVVPATIYFLFIIMTRFSYFIQSCLNGASAYVATGRADPLYRRSFRHMFRYYGSTHFMPGMFLLAIVVLYIDVETRPIMGSVIRTLWHWGVGLSFIITPCIFNPAISMGGAWEDLKNFYLWVFGDVMEKLKKQKDVLTKKATNQKKDKFWAQAYEKIAAKHHPSAARSRAQSQTMGSTKIVREYEQQPVAGAGAGAFADGAFGEEYDSTESVSALDEDFTPAGYTRGEDLVLNRPEGAWGARDNQAQGDSDDDLSVEDIHIGAFGTVDDKPPAPQPARSAAGAGKPVMPGLNLTAVAGDYKQHSMPVPDDASTDPSVQNMSFAPNPSLVTGPNASRFTAGSSAPNMQLANMSFVPPPINPLQDTEPTESDPTAPDRPSTGSGSDEDETDYDDMFESVSQRGAIPLAHARSAHKSGFASGFGLTKDRLDSHTGEKRKSMHGAPRLGGALPGAEDEDKLADDEDDFDYEWLCRNLRDESAIEKYLTAFAKIPGRHLGPATHGGKVPNKVVEWKAMKQGFIMLGKVVDEHNCKELLMGMGISEVNFVQFVIVFNKAESADAGQAEYGIDRAITDVHRARHREVAHLQREMAKGRRGFGKSRGDTEKIAVLTVLSNTRREFKVQFRDSTEDKALIKTNSLKHHWKVSMIMGYRGCSTISGLLFAFFQFGLWSFAYLALWQDIFWEVFYLVLVITWDFLLGLSNVGQIVLVTRGMVFVFILYRILMMLQTTNIFYPTLVVLYGLMHVFIDLQFSFWSCLGPYLRCRKVPGKKLDEQRENCLIMMLRDDREHLLWGFTYYFTFRQIIVIIVGLIQFIFTLILLLIRTIIAGLKWLGNYISEKQHGTNPTEGTFAARAGQGRAGEEDQGQPLTAHKATMTQVATQVNKMCQVVDPRAKGNTVSQGTENVWQDVEGARQGFDAGASSGESNDDAGPPPALDGQGVQCATIYFGTDRQTKFVAAEDFDSVEEFRKGVKTFYGFMGPLEQIHLTLFGKLIEDTDPWPLYTSKQLPVQVALGAKTQAGQRQRTNLESRLAGYGS